MHVTPSIDIAHQSIDTTFMRLHLFQNVGGFKDELFGLFLNEW